MTLQESVAAAAKEQVIDVEKTSEKEEKTTPVEKQEKTEEKVKEEKEEKKTSEKQERGEPLEVPETEEQVQQALNIYRTLNNPQTAGTFIQQLATAAGIQAAKVEDKTGEKITPKEASQAVVDILKESLGEENEDLAIKLAPALEKLIAKEVKKPIEQLNYESQVRQVQIEVDNTFNKLSVELPDFNSLQKEMNALMQNIQPGPKTSMEDYVRTIYKAAGGSMPGKTAAKNSKEVSSAKVVEKMVKNAKETKSNVSSDVDEERVTKTSHRPTIREAVLAAAKSLNEQNNN